MQDPIEERIDVVQERVSSVSGPSGVNNYVDKNVEKHQNVDRPTHDYQDEEEEGETAAPPVKHSPVRPDVEETPVIVYPSGTVPQFFGPTEGQQQQQQQQQTEEGEVEEQEQGFQSQYPQENEEGVPPQRFPRPPGPQGRYPPPPPSGRAPLLRRPPPPPPNWRRPPPPSAAQPYPEPPFSRNVPEEELPLEAAPRQSPFDGPPRPRPRPEASGGVLGSIGSTLSNLGGNIKCAAEDIGADVRLQDEAFMQRQLDCVLDKGPCDELGASVKRKYNYFFLKHEKITICITKLIKTISR